MYWSAKRCSGGSGVQGLELGPAPLLIQGCTSSVVGLTLMPQVRVLLPLAVAQVASAFRLPGVLFAQLLDKLEVFRCARGFQSSNLNEMKSGNARCVRDAQEIAEVFSCPFEYVAVVIQMRASEAAPLPPETDVGTIIYPAVACPSSCE